MLGYWLDDAPVRTGREDVLATAYVRPDAVLVVLASWAEDDVAVALDADWPALGLPGPASTVAVAPEVAGLQPAATLDLRQPIPVPGGQGLFLVLRPR